MDASGARHKPQSRACEQCRRSKVKCQVGLQPGICKRCSEFKRECIFRTGPRTRRPKVSSGNTEIPPPPGPSQTFSIDFTMPGDDEPSADLDELLDKHQRFIDELVPSDDDDEYQSTMPSSSSGPSLSNISQSTPISSASPRTRPVGDLSIKPQFNLDSAGKLLQTFKGMLSYFPCIVLPADANVKSMAREAPFVLLAILAATSCSTSLQGYSLYDEEFRKILGLKFVTGGERSLELLQGILVYCTWYPFYLRPKNRQAFQYLRMATDIVHDLELDQEETFANRLSTGPTDHDLESIRTFIACFQQVSVFARAWGKPSTLPYSHWIGKCCDILEQHSTIEQDYTLVWLGRLQHIFDEITELNQSYKTPLAQSEHHRNLIRIGLESQFRDWQSMIPSNIASQTTLVMANLFTETLLLAAPLMRAPKPRTGIHEVPLDPAKLMNATHTLRTFFDFAVTLYPEDINDFSSTSQSHLILSIILAYRLCLPLDVCPGFNDAQARKNLNFGKYLEQLTQEPDSRPPGQSNRTDASTAFRVVLRALKDKYYRKVLAAEAKSARSACPMIDGSLDEYISMWDGQGETTLDGYDAASLSGTRSGAANPLAVMADPGEGKPMLFHDLWATMTMGWAADDMADLNMTEGQFVL